MTNNNMQKHPFRGVPMKRCSKRYTANLLDNTHVEA